MKNKKSQLKTGIVLNYVNLGLGNLIPIFYTPVMLSILGQNEYGLFKLSSSVTSYLSLISLGLGSAITRYIIKAREQQGKEAEENVLGLFCIIFRIIAIAAFAVGLIMTANLHIWYGNALSSPELSRMRILVFLMVCNMALSFLVSPFISVVSAHEEFVFLQCMNIISTCVGPIANLIALFMGFASVGMAVSGIIINLVTQCCYCIFVYKKMHLRPRYKALPINLLKEIMAFSFWIFVANVVGQLYNATDTIMIGAIPALAAAGVAVYNVGGVFSSIVSSLTIGVSSLLAPKTNSMVFSGASNEELTDLAIKVGRIQCYIICLLVTGFIAFGRPFIGFYAGSEYGEAFWVAVFMMVPNVIPLVQSVCLNVVVAQNRHKFRSLVYLGIAILNVVGTWFLMQKWGIIGAAFMTGFALIVGPGFVMNWFYHFRTGLDMVRFWKEVGEIYIFPAVLCVITLVASRWIDFYNISAWIAGVVIYTAIYSIFNWRIVMNTYEKGIIEEPLRKISAVIKRKDNQ